MGIKKVLLYSILIGVFCQCKTSQEIQFKDGKCFAKCVVPFNPNEIPEGDYDEYAVYTGNELEEEVLLEEKEILIQKKSSKWVKKMAPGDCLSADPKDCMVWCLVETPEKIEKFQVLLDTTQSANYEIKKIYKNANANTTESIQWKEVVCENEITTEMISQIQASLKKSLYYNGGISGELDILTKRALRKFQEDNYLPLGQLDLETLDVLGIKFTKL